MCKCKTVSGQLTTNINGKKIVVACLNCFYLKGSICKARGACTCSLPECPLKKW